MRRSEELAIKHHLEAFASCFHRGLNALESDDPMALIDGKDWLPETEYCLTAKQLVAAACNGWVFGGMGSWNDLGFDAKTENKEYEELSRELYAVINSCIERA